MRLVPRGPVYLYLLEALRIPELGMEKWLSLDGDATMLLTHELNAGSLVIDVGGCEGNWIGRLSERYGCRALVFEPVPEFALGIAKRFSENAKIEVLPFGLGGETRVAPIFVDAAEPEATSLFGRGASIEVRLVRALDFLQQRGIRSIDLMQINIEGGEYELLQHLIETGWIRNIGNVQVQFHDAFPGARKLMVQLQNELRKTHYPTYEYPLVWENWRLKPKWRTRFSNSTIP